MEVIFGGGLLGLIALYFINRGDESLSKREASGLLYGVIFVTLFLAACVVITQSAGVNSFAVA